MVQALHHDLFLEFQRLRCAGVKFNRHLLKILALRLVQNSTNGFYGPLVRDPTKGDLVKDHINLRWIQSFMQQKDIVSRTKTGKLMLSPAKRELIHREVAYYLGQLSREFNSGTLDEECVFNSDETHFVFNLHNHKTLAMRGDKEVKYADVISGDEGMIMMVTISGGISSLLYPAFLIFQNDNRSYPIRNLPDNIPGAAYRSGPKGWMDGTVFVQWLLENRVLGPLPAGKKRVLYMDNCSSHAVTEEFAEALKKINTELRFFPKNATDLCQPADSFIIQKLKAAWRARWDLKKIEMVEKGLWSSAHKGSGKLTNPRKQYFMQLPADVVLYLNVKRDKEGVLYTRKAMIRCGLSRNLNGVWEECQLFQHLQEIIEKYPPRMGQFDKRGQFGNLS